MFPKPRSTDLQYFVTRGYFIPYFFLSIIYFITAFVAKLVPIRELFYKISKSLFKKK